MSGAQGPVQILSTLVNGSFEWTFGQDAVWAGDAGDFVLRATALGSGAVGATVTAYRGSRVGASVVYDDLAAATFTLSGTNLSVLSQAFRQTGDVHWKFVVASITASTTVVVSCGWWQL